MDNFLEKLAPYAEELRRDGVTYQRLAPTTPNAKLLFDAFTAESERLRFWFTFEAPKSVEATLEYLRGRESERSILMFGVFKRGKFVGECGFTNINHANKSVAVGMWLIREAEGLWLPSRTLKAFEDMAFDVLEANKVRAGMDARAIISQRIMQRGGYSKEGCLRQDMLYPADGTYGDTVIYSKLREEWLAEGGRGQAPPLQSASETQM